MTEMYLEMRENLNPGDSFVDYYQRRSEHNERQKKLDEDIKKARKKQKEESKKTIKPMPTTATRVMPKPTPQGRQSSSLASDLRMPDWRNPNFATIQNRMEPPQSVTRPNLSVNPGLSQELDTPSFRSRTGIQSDIIGKPTRKNREDLQIEKKFKDYQKKYGISFNFSTDRAIKDIYEDPRKYKRTELDFKLLQSNISDLNRTYKPKKIYIFGNDEQGVTGRLIEAYAVGEGKSGMFDSVDGDYYIVIKNGLAEKISKDWAAPANKLPPDLRKRFIQEQVTRHDLKEKREEPGLISAGSQNLPLYPLVKDEIQTGEQFISRAAQGAKEYVFGNPMNDLRPDVGKGVNLPVVGNVKPGNIAADMTGFILGGASIGSGGISGYNPVAGATATGQNLLSMSNKAGRVVADGVKNKYLKSAVEGAVSTAPISAYEAISQGMDTKEAAKKVALESVLGAGLFAGGTALKSAGKRIIKGKQPVADAVEETVKRKIKKPVAKKETVKVNKDFEGKYKVKTYKEGYKKAVQEQQELFENITNEVGHYKITKAEREAIRQKYGSDIDKVLDNLQQAEIKAKKMPTKKQIKYRRLAGLYSEKEMTVLKELNKMRKSKAPVYKGDLKKFKPKVETKPVETPIKPTSKVYRVKSGTLKPSKVTKAQTDEIKKSLKRTDLSEGQAKELERLESKYKADKKDIETNVNMNYQEKGSALKGLGMRYSADKRKVIQGKSLDNIEGSYTGRESFKAREREAEINYKGKKVLADGKEGKIVSTPYGKVKVEHLDGTTKTYDPISIKPIKKVKEADVPVQSFTRDVLEDQVKFNKALALDKDVSKLTSDQQEKVITEAFDKVGKLMSGRIKKATGLDKPADILNFYAKKLGVEGKVEFLKTLKNPNRPAALDVKHFQDTGNVRIKYNPNLSDDQVIAGIRHEMQHVEDIMNGYVGKPDGMPSNFNNIEDYYKQINKDHFKDYEWFEPEYLRKGLLKDLDSGFEPPKGDGGISTKKRIIKKPTPFKQPQKTTVSEAKVVEKEAYAGYGEARNFKTVRDADTTSETARKFLEKRMNPLYKKEMNEIQWDKALRDIAEDHAKVEAELLSKRTVYTSEDVARSYALMDVYDAAGNLEGFARVHDNLAVKGSEVAQALQAFTIWKKRGSKNMVSLYEHMLKRSYNESGGYRYKELKNELKDLDRIINDIKAKTNKTPKDLENLDLYQTRYKKKKSKLDILERKLKDIKKNATPEDIAFIEKNFKTFQETEDGYQSMASLARIMQFMADQQRVSGIEIFKGFQRVSLLANPASWIVNPMMNVVRLGTDAVQDRTAGALIDIITSLFTGHRETLGIGFLKTSIPKYIKGFGEGMGLLWRDMRVDVVKGQGFFKNLDAMTRGVDTAMSRGQFEIPFKTTFKPIKAKGKFTSKAVKPINASLEIMRIADSVVRRALSAGDRGFMHGAYIARKAELEKILSKGKAGFEKGDIDSLALGHAIDKMWQGTSGTEHAIKTLKSIKGLRVLVEVMIPFSKVPANAFSYVTDHVPPLVLSKLIRQFAKDGIVDFNQKLFVERLSRMFTGSGLMVLAGLMYKNGMITGSNKIMSKTKKSEFDKLRGVSQQSIKIGDNWFSYANTGAVGSIFATAADYMQETGGLSPTLEGTFRGSNTMIQSSLLGGIADLFEGMNLTESMAKAIWKQTSQSEPSFMKKYAKMYENHIIETYNDNFVMRQLNVMESGVPWLRKDLPKMYDVLGQPLKYDEPGASLLFSPFRYQTEKSSKIIDTINKIYQDNLENPDIKNINEVLPRYAQKSIQINNKEYKIKNATEFSEWSKIFGENQKEMLDEIVNIPNFKNFSPVAQVKIISRVTERAAKISKLEYYNMYPEKFK
jgi:hypothetical protein